MAQLQEFRTIGPARNAGLSETLPEAAKTFAKEPVRMAIARRKVILLPLTLLPS
jgi:hypothetical protein